MLSSQLYASTIYLRSSIPASDISSGTLFITQMLATGRTLILATDGLRMCPPDFLEGGRGNPHRCSSTLVSSSSEDSAVQCHAYWPGDTDCTNVIPGGTVSSTARNKVLSSSCVWQVSSTTIACLLGSDCSPSCKNCLTDSMMSLYAIQVLESCTSASDGSI